MHILLHVSIVLHRRQAHNAGGTDEKIDWPILRPNAPPGLETVEENAEMKYHVGKTQESGQVQLLNFHSCGVGTYLRIVSLEEHAAINKRCSKH